MPTLHKIDPNNLRDTIVEVRYEGIYDFSVLKGIFYGIFKDEFTSLTTLSSIKIQLPGQGEMKLNGFEGLDFRKDDVKVTFTDERIHFNTIEVYPGWETFSATINQVINLLEDHGLIRSVKSVGIRYISDHMDYRITEIAKVNWSLDTRYGSVSQGTLRQQYALASDIVTVTLADTISKSSKNAPMHVAIIDIDVTHQFEPTQTGTALLFETIERLHGTQKMFFEDIINQDYLASLNPQYR